MSAVSRSLRGLLLVAGLVAAEPSLSQAADGHWAGVAEQVIAEVDRAEAAMKAGNFDAAEEAAIASYFDFFEGLNMEIAERQALGARRVSDVEALFHDLQSQAAKRADLHGVAASLRKALRADAKQLDADKVGPDGHLKGK
ncbi:hypothetical protein [Magnetospirillum molischianum]|uniref:Uncharacterized protein n=1 Tax=Magnetospirillum molischianum DSM 120 TaxID=1150626 RepID=H8FN42_MAGML|nr:hypothetical protein [Magnetospirillum molischianum]CCG39780.1 conserved exported hypothetical protein [Magnetospirillum molischianum DSM 120]